MQVTYRGMEEGDYDAILAIAKVAKGIRFHPYEDRAWHAGFLVRNPGLCFVAVSKTGAVVGFVYCGNDGRRATINHLAVDERYRKQQIGSRLLELVEAAVRACGIRRAQLMILKGNERVADFYARTGWKQRDDVIMMYKDL